MFAIKPTRRTYSTCGRSSTLLKHRSYVRRCQLEESTRHTRGRHRLMCSDGECLKLEKSARRLNVHDGGFRGLKEPGRRLEDAVGC